MAEVIAIATAGRILSPLITNLILKGCSFFNDGIIGKVQALQAITLPKIKAVIEEAEKREIESQALLPMMLRMSLMSITTNFWRDKQGKNTGKLQVTFSLLLPMLTIN